MYLRPIGNHKARDMDWSSLTASRASCESKLTIIMLPREGVAERSNGETTSSLKASRLLDFARQNVTGDLVGRICSHELSRILDPGLFRGPLVGRFHFNPSSSDLHVYARIVYKSCFACSGSLACICTVAHDQCQYGILVSNSIEVTVQCSVLF